MDQLFTQTVLNKLFLYIDISKGYYWGNYIIGNRLIRGRTKYLKCPRPENVYTPVSDHLFLL